MRIPENDIRAVKSKDPTYLKFLVNALDEVERWESRVRKRIASKALEGGKWHPTGFAVFKIGKIEGLGQLRLHIWPSEVVRERLVRRRLVGAPEVHTHAFYLYSKVLEGGYRDSQYDVEDCKAPTGDPSPDTGKKYKIDYAPTGEGDLYRDMERWATMDLTDPRVDYPAGNWHEMQSGLFHSTPISHRTFCATLALMSPREHGHDILVGNPNFGTTLYTRPSVIQEEMELMCDQFNEAAISRTGNVLHTTDVKTGKLVKRHNQWTPGPPDGGESLFRG